MKKSLKRVGVGASLTCAALIAASVTDRMEVVGADQDYSYRNADAGWMNFSILGHDVYLSTQPFTDEDKVDREGYPLNSSQGMYEPNTKIPGDVARKIAETIVGKGVVCPENAMTVDYTPLEPEQSTTVHPASDVTTVEGTLPLRICVDYVHTILEDQLLVFPLTIESRTGTPPLDLSFPEVTDFCREVSRNYSEVVNADLHRTPELRILLDSANFDFNIAMSPYAESPCDSTNLRNVQQEER